MTELACLDGPATAALSDQLVAAELGADTAEPDPPGMGLRPRPPLRT